MADERSRQGGSRGQAMPGLTGQDVLAMLRGMLREFLAEVPGPSLPGGGGGMDEALRRGPGLPAAARAVGRMFGLSESCVAALAGADHLGVWADAVLEDVGPHPARLTFFTSGSTGQPVAHAHETALLWQEMLAQAELYPGRKRVVGFAPCHHIYGFLFLVLLPKALGVPRMVLPPLPSAAQARLLSAGDLVVAFPLFWKGLSQLDAHIAQDVLGVTSTGPCPAEVIHALRERGLERCMEIYGSSETGGIGYRDSPESEYTLFDYWAPAAGPGQGGVLARLLPDGRRSAPCPLPDVVQWTAPRSFTLAGRRDRAVQVGGVNVYPDRVRAEMLRHPGVSDCAVRLMRPEEGGRLKAFVVPRRMPEDPVGFRNELFCWLNGRLTPHEMPKSIAIGPILPSNAMGKMVDWNVST